MEKPDPLIGKLVLSSTSEWASLGIVVEATNTFRSRFYTVRWFSEQHLNGDPEHGLDCDDIVNFIGYYNEWQSKQK